MSEKFTVHRTDFPEFNGFTPEAFQFLRNLERNNTKDWFADHREVYKTYVAGPMLALAHTLTPVLIEIDDLFDTRDSRLISRPHRDTRFSKDKSPYHTASWLVFRRPGDKMGLVPAYYFEISPNGMRYGMGFYQAPPKAMGSLRDAIDDDPARFQSIFKKLEKLEHLRLEGDSYSRKMTNEHGEWFQKYYQKKNIYFISEEGFEAAMNSNLVARLVKDFTLLAPAYQYFLQMIDFT